MLRVGLSRAPALARLVAMRRKKLQCIRAFVRELDAATRTEYSRQVRETRLVRAYHRLPADVQGVVADGYRQCLMASEDDAGAARQAVLNDLVRGTGLTREQILALPPVKRRRLGTCRLTRNINPLDAADASAAVSGP